MRESFVKGANWRNVGTTLVPIRVGDTIDEICPSFPLEKISPIEYSLGESVLDDLERALEYCFWASI